MKRFLLTVTLVSFIGLGAFVLGGCGQNPTQQSKTEPSSTSTSNASAVTNRASEIPHIGKGDATVQVSNETGYDIVGISVKDSNDVDYSAQNSFEGFNFPNGASIELSFTSAESAPSYDVLLLTSENSKIAIRSIQLIDAANIAFHFEEGIGYITYTDTTSGETVDNKKQAFEAEGNALVMSSDLETQKG